MKIPSHWPAHDYPQQLVEHLPIHQDGWDPEKLSRAVVASDGRGAGCVLHVAGGHMDQLFGTDDVRGLTYFPNAPSGVSVWTGYVIRVHEYDDWSTNPEPRAELVTVGTYRQLSPLERAAVVANRRPWDPNYWKAAPDIPDVELEYEWYRATGQGVNENPRGVKVTHRPTGIFAMHSDAQTTSKNRALAREKLKRIMHGSQYGPYPSPSMLTEMGFATDMCSGGHEWWPTCIVCGEEHK